MKTMPWGSFRCVWVGLLAGATVLDGQVVEFDSPRWQVLNGSMVEVAGERCFQGTAVLGEVDFHDGIVEVDVHVDGGRSYPGVVFRMQSNASYERFYVRPHKAGLYPDALQYTPVFNSVAGWQLYSGPGYTAGTAGRLVGWHTLRLEVSGDRTDVYVTPRGHAPSARPTLIVPRLEHGDSRGGVGVLGPADGSACFANFRYSDETVALAPADPAPAAEEGTILEWEISRSVKAAQIDRTAYPRFYTIFAAGWEPVVAESTGLVDISRHRERAPNGADMVLARTVVHSDSRKDVRLSFGYSDEIDLFLNGKKVFGGASGYRSRDPSFAGIIGYHDHVNVTLTPGRNEVFAMVSEAFGGWGLMGKLDTAIERPAVDRTRLTKVWEAGTFLTPETVVYDANRDVLFVSSFDLNYQRSEEPSGYISMLSLDGEVLEQRWVGDLHAPTGMAIDGGRLYVLERGSLTEIDIETREVSARYPIPNPGFPNDLTLAEDGSIYITDTSPDSWLDSRIYRFRDGAVELWMNTDEIVRANGVLADGGSLLVGNTGDGILKRVDLVHRTVEDVIGLGAGVIDGIQVAEAGTLLVSHWEGPLYVLEDGRLTEVLDGRELGQNSADFAYLPEHRLIVIPTFVDNRVVAYRLNL